MLRCVGFNQATMANRAAAMKSFPQCGRIVFSPGAVALLAAQLFAFDIDEAAGILMLKMMAASATRLIKARGMVRMGETDLRPSQFSENILMGQGVISLLGHRIRRNDNPP